MAVAFVEFVVQHLFLFSTMDAYIMFLFSFTHSVAHSFTPHSFADWADFDSFRSVVLYSNQLRCKQTHFRNTIVVFSYVLFTFFFFFFYFSSPIPFEWKWRKKRRERERENDIKPTTQSLKMGLR